MQLSFHIKLSWFLDQLVNNVYVQSLHMYHEEILLDVASFPSLVCGVSWERGYIHLLGDCRTLVEPEHTPNYAALNTGGVGKCL